MMERIVYLDRSLLPTAVRRPPFEHEWIAALKFAGFSHPSNTDSMDNPVKRQLTWESVIPRTRLHSPRGHTRQPG